MKNSKKILAVLLTAAMLLSFAPCAFAEGDESRIDYTISNPYAGVDFDSYHQYKTDLHSHTLFSDGGYTLPEMVERHYELGFDIMAITDHGSVSYGYTEQDHWDVMKLVSLVRKKRIDSSLLDESGTAENGNAYKVFKQGGDEFYQQTLADGTDGQTMLRVPYGVENNPTSFNNAHVNSWFVDYGHKVIGGTSNYERPISNVDKLGGLSVINHPGEYSNARDELYTADAYNAENPMYNYKINKFAHLLRTYGTCIGIDVNSKGDYRTRFDRKLWDILLQKVTPTGRNVLGIASTDSHNLDIVDSGYVLALMPEKTSAALKKSLESGQFFAASKYIGNYDELVQLYEEVSVIKSLEASRVAGKLSEAVKNIAAQIENGKQKDQYKVEDGTVAPKVTNIIVDNTADTITVTAELLCSTAVTAAPASTPRTGLPVTAASRLFRRLPAAVSRLWLSASMPYKNSAKPPKSVKILVRFCSTAAAPPAETFLILFMQLPGGSGFLPFSPFVNFFKIILNRPCILGAGGILLSGVNS